jgi:hemoglobin
MNLSGAAGGALAGVIIGTLKLWMALLSLIHSNFNSCHVFHQSQPGITQICIVIKYGGEQSMSSFFEKVGGDAFFADLTSQFYAVVATDPILRPMYPDEDMKGAAQRLQWFLAQYWGGPTTYQENRGHSRLRMRHSQFSIDTCSARCMVECNAHSSRWC